MYKGERLLSWLADLDVEGVAEGDYLRSDGAIWALGGISQILTDLLTVDGAGSGLDADLLDGLEGAAYLLVDGTRPLTGPWNAGRFQATNLGTVMVQITAPTSPATGQLWLDTDATGTTTETISVRTVTADHTATDSDNLILCDAATGSITITLPTALGRIGKVFRIKKIDSSGNSVTADGNGSETIDGSTTASLTVQYEAITIASDGSNWHIL